MKVTGEIISRYLKMLNNPIDYAFNFKPITECFEKSEEITPTEDLRKQYSAYTKLEINQVLFFGVLKDLFPNDIAEDQNGNLGFRLAFKRPN